MANYTKRGDKWQVRLMVDGKYKCKTFTTKAQAKAWAEQTATRIRQGDVAPVQDYTFLDLVRKYAAEVSPTKRSSRWELYAAKRLESLPFADLKLQAVTPEFFAMWRDARLKTVSGATVNREFTLMGAMFEYARRELRWVSVNPVRDVRKPKNSPPRERIYGENEVDAICTALGFDGVEVTTNSHQLAVLFLLSLETAMRRNEMLGLSWDDILFDKKIARLRLTKTGDARDVPLSPKAMELLKLLRSRSTPFSLSPAYASILFKRTTARIGIEGATFHDARATALTRLSKKLSVLELARMVGHRHLGSLMIYYRESAEVLADKLG